MPVIARECADIYCLRRRQVGCEWPPLRMVGSTMSGNPANQAPQEAKQLAVELPAAEAPLDDVRDSKFYAGVLNGLTTFIAVLDLEGTVLFVNDTPLNLAGMTLEDTLGKKFYDCYWWSYSPAARESIRRDISTCATGASLTHEIDVLTADLTTITIDFSMHPVYDDDGHVCYVIPEGRDVTTRKLALAEAEEVTKKLGREQKLKEIGLLASGVAHDLNNVLVPITGYAELLLLQEELSEACRPAVETILKAGHKAAAIVADLLTIAQGAAAKKAPLDLAASTLEFLESGEFHALADRHPGVSVETHFESQVFAVNASPIHIQKILLNLVSNAFEGIENEGVVSISVDNHYRDHASEHNPEFVIGEYVRLRVSDTGEGVEEDVLSRIFEPFFSTKVLGQSGTGLGLTVVHNAVQEHGAFIGVASSGEGTHFDIHFPISRAALDPSDEEASLGSLRGSGQRVLVVDDDVTSGELLADMLKHLGYQGFKVNSGEAAVDVLAHQDFDLLVLDMIMPGGMDGYQTYRAIKEIHPSQRAILVSGYSRTEDAEGALALGAGTFLSKPVRLGEFALAVKRELSR